jgi:hypothetical protein
LVDFLGILPESRSHLPRAGSVRRRGERGSTGREGRPRRDGQIGGGGGTNARGHAARAGAGGRGVARTVERYRRGRRVRTARAGLEATSRTRGSECWRRSADTQKLAGSRTGSGIGREPLPRSEFLVAKTLLSVNVMRSWSARRRASSAAAPRRGGSARSRRSRVAAARSRSAMFSAVKVRTPRPSPIRHPAFKRSSVDRSVFPASTSSARD